MFIDLLVFHWVCYLLCVKVDKDKSFVETSEGNENMEPNKGVDIKTQVTANDNKLNSFRRTGVLLSCGWNLPNSKRR